MKRVLTVLIVLLIVPGLVLNAEEKVKTIKGSQIASVKGSVRSWDDAVKTMMGRKGQVTKMKPVLNFENPRQITLPADTHDPVAQTPADMSRSTKAISGVSGFAGMTFSANGAGWPPDTCGDVGPSHYVQAVNTSIGIYNKSTGAKISSSTFDAFFQGSGITGTPCDEDNNGDPIVLYDWYAQRWFILDFAWNSTHSNGFWFSIAVSQSSDPTGSWYQYAFQADATYMNDYPKAGVWEDGIYITANMFNYSTGAFQGVKVWALKKPDLYNGTLTSLSIFDNSWQAWSILPSNAKGTTAPTTGDPCYMFALDASEYGSPSIDAIYWWKADVNWTANTFTWTGPYTMTTAAFGLTATGIKQKCGATLDSLYGRLMHSAIYRKFATYGSVYLCHVVEGSSRRLMRWYEIRINSGTCSINQQSTFSPTTDTYSRWMGSIGGDKDGKIAMGYSTGNNKLNAAIRVLDCVGASETNVKSAGGCQYTYTRWGDYSYMTIDPSDDKTFWYTHEYMAANGTNWQTWICKFQVN